VKNVIHGITRGGNVVRFTRLSDGGIAVHQRDAGAADYKFVGEVDGLASLDPDEDALMAQSMIALARAEGWT
jgi:hypothetical protein